MDERELASQEAWAKEDRENAAALAEIGIMPAEASLFNVIHFGLTVPPSDLCRRAAGRDYTVGGPGNVRVNRAALAGCLSKGWLQIVDEATVGRLRDEVRQGGLLGPVYGYPTLGGVDFTPAGAEHWFRMCERLWNSGHDASFPFTDVVHEKTAHYIPSRSKALVECERWKEDDDVVSIEGPFPIGPWRANWWRRFPEGYRIDVEQRRQWQGRCSGGGGSVLHCVMSRSIDREHAKDILDRHNVAWGEWLVLASLEFANSKREVAYFITDRFKRFGMNLSEAECQISLEACLRNGWLRDVDDRVTAEIRNLLCDDAAVMPVPYDPEKRWAEIDFSIEGAELYRMVSAEIFGQDWEESISVEDTYFREEHRYCATETRLAGVVQGYAESGETPTSIRTLPIGPWCVYWWRRFRSGYRLELTFGEP